MSAGRMLTLFTKILGDSTSSSGYILAQLLGALAGTGIAYGLVHDTIEPYLNLQHDSRWTYDLLGANAIHPAYPRCSSNSINMRRGPLDSRPMFYLLSCLGLLTPRNKRGDDVSPTTSSSRSS